MKLNEIAERDYHDSDIMLKTVQSLLEKGLHVRLHLTVRYIEDGKVVSNKVHNTRIYNISKDMRRTEPTNVPWITNFARAADDGVQDPQTRGVWIPHSELGEMDLEHQGDFWVLIGKRDVKIKNYAA